MNIDELAKLHENDYPSYFLADWYQAALPSYEIHLRVLMQVEEPLPAIDLFVLRAMEIKVNTVNEISKIYGLEHAITYDALEHLQRDGYITILRSQSGNGQQELLNITKKGRQILETLVFTHPEEEIYHVCMDALVGEYYPHRRLLTSKDIRTLDFYQIPAYLDVPEYDQIDVVNLKRVWREVRRTLGPLQKTRELLDVIARDNWFLGYRAMRVLQFINKDSGNVIIHVYDGVEHSPRHEAALLKMEQEGIRALRAEPKRGPDESTDPILEVVSSDLYKAAILKKIEIPRIERNITSIQQQIQETKDVAQASTVLEDTQQAQSNQRQLTQEIQSLKSQIKELEDAAPTLQILSMTEHRPMLFQALREAIRRVLIISPWLNPTAVNRELRSLIAETIGRGVEVWIGYGFGESDYREKQTLRMLEEIQQQVKGGKRLRICRLQDSHAKVIICDASYMVTTSFNWLSFAGDPNRGNRVEFGTLTRDPVAVRAMLERLLPMFEENVN